MNSAGKFYAGARKYSQANLILVNCSEIQTSRVRGSNSIADKLIRLSESSLDCDWNHSGEFPERFHSHRLRWTSDLHLHFSVDQPNERIWLTLCVIRLSTKLSVLSKQVDSCEDLCLVFLRYKRNGE